MSLVAQATGGTPPAPPTNLAARATGSTAIEVTWTASTGATSYRVYRNGATTPAATVTSTSFTDTGLTASTSYQYEVSAVNAAGESAKAGPVSATTDAGGSVTGPKLAAAGDISCDPISGATCRNRAMQTSDLIVGQGYDAVLPLGDNQYECGGYSAYLQNYDPTWGRVKAISRPIPGDNDWATSGGTDCPTAPVAAISSTSAAWPAIRPRATTPGTWGRGTWSR
jgi:phosphodiesterase/alkaline phosphatase D-like protein